MTRYKIIKIHKKPSFLKITGFFYYSAQAIGNTVFVPESLYKELMENKIDVTNEAILIHENTHLEEQRKLGLSKWLIKYLLNKNFRYEQELIANKAELRYLTKKGVDTNKLIKSRAKAISGWRYLWAERYEVIHRELS